MAQATRGIPQVRGNSIEELKRELNLALQFYGRQLDQLQGLVAGLKEFSDLNMGGKRITSIADPQGNDDAQKKGLALSRATTKAVWDASEQKITRGNAGTDSNDFVTLRQLKEATDLGVIISTDLPVQVDAGDLGAAGGGVQASSDLHEHPVNTAAAGALSTIDAGDTADAGTATSLPRGDHQHAVSTALAAALSTIQAGDTADAGTATTIPRADHQHPVETAVAVNIAAVGSAAGAGTSTTLPRGDHVHPGVDLTTVQTVAGAKTWSDKGTFSGEVEIDGALNHDGTTFGAFGTIPTTQQTASANLTDSTTGTANDTVIDVGVAFNQATLNDNFADCIAKINKCLTTLRAFGFIAP